MKYQDRVITPKVGDTIFKLGMTLADIKAIIGEPDEIYPTKEEFDPEFDDTTYYMYNSLGLSFEFKAILKKVTDKTKVYAIHYKKYLLNNEDKPLVRADVIKKYGQPIDRSFLGWEIYSGFQATYDDGKFEVVSCISVFDSR